MQPIDTAVVSNIRVRAFAPVDATVSRAGLVVRADRLQRPVGGEAGSPAMGEFARDACDATRVACLQMHSFMFYFAPAFVTECCAAM